MRVVTLCEYDNFVLMDNLRFYQHPPILMRIRLPLMTVALAIALTACGGGSSNPSPAPAPAPPSITLSSTSSQALSGGKPVALSATVSGSDAVTWQLAAGSPGSLSATGGNTVNYVPPANVTATARVDIVANAGGASKTISLTLYPDPGAPGLSHIAGSLGGPGYLDGAGTAARFTNIVDAAADSAGNLYVVESGAYNVIRKITSAGVVTTVLEGADGHADGPAGQAKVGNIRALAVGGSGSLLFIDSANNSTYLRQLAPDGSVTTLVQHPLLAGARALAAGPGNTAYVMRMRSIVMAGAGSATELAGDESDDTNTRPVDGGGNGVSFAGLSAMTPDRDGNLLVAQYGRLSKVTPTGAVSTVRFMPTTENTLSLTLDANGIPLALVNTASSDAGWRYAVQRLGPSGEVSTLFAGSYRDVAFDLDQTIPLQLRMAGGKLLLTRSTDVRQLQNNTWQPFAGLAHESFADVDGPGSTARFANPELLAADGAGNLYVSDYPRAYNWSFAGRWGGLYLRKIAPDNTVRTLLVQEAFGVPHTILADNAGTLYVSEIMPLAGHQIPLGGAVYKVTQDGKLSLLAGQAATIGASTQQVDGVGSAARFIRPKLVGVDTAGNVYVNDTYSDTPSFRKIAPDGTVTTIAALPAGVGATPDGYTYTAEHGAIYRVTGTGKEVVAGVPWRYGTKLGVLPGGLDSRVAVTPTGPYSFAVISGSAILKLVLPH